MTDSPGDIHAGGCAAWALPADVSASGIARALLDRTLTAIELPDELIYNAALICSEMTSNAVLHGMDGAPSGHPPGPTGAPELCCTSAATPPCS